MNEPDENNDLIPTTLRHNARCGIIQALYQLQFNCHDYEEVLQQFQESHSRKQIDLPYFKKTFSALCNNLAVIDQTLEPSLDRKLKSLNPVELAILRLAVFELKFCPEIPYKVVINEAVEIAKNYGATSGYKYINGVLDNLAKTLRTHETKS